jgi:hypothetical protein
MFILDIISKDNGNKFLDEQFELYLKISVPMKVLLIDWKRTFENIYFDFKYIGHMDFINDLPFILKYQ